MTIRHKAASIISVAVMTASLTAALSGVANADTPYGEIRPLNSSFGNGKCLDVRKEDDYYHANARVQQWDCSGALEQQWSSHPYDTVLVRGAYRVIDQIISLRSGMCMEVRGGGTSIGTQVDQIPCGNGPSSTISNQLWMETQVSGTSVFKLEPYNAVSIDARLCLDVRGASGDNGAMLQQYTCKPQTNQEFFGPALING